MNGMGVLNRYDSDDFDECNTIRHDFQVLCLL